MQGKKRCYQVLGGSMTNPENWVTFIFVVISLMVFVNGGTYSSTPMISGLSMIFLVPMAILQAVAGLSGMLLPVFVIGFFAYVLMLNKVFGEALWILAVFAGIIVTLGA